MKKVSSKQQPPEDALERYDESRATRGKYAGKLATGTPWRRLEDDLATAVPTTQDVNDALRAVLALRAVIEPKRKRRAA